MKWVRAAAIATLILVSVICLFASWISPAPYAKQFRELPNAAPSRQHLLGTDDLGRDRLTRVLYGTRVSLLLAPAAALLSTLLAAFIGGIAGYRGGWPERVAMAAADLFLSLPWLFVLVTVRALLPLNVSPMESVTITFMLLGLFGWAASARIVCAGARSLRNSDFVLQARASGVKTGRLLCVHVLPNLKPVLLAQFWVSIPVFILAEANLGILGLGVAEPLPSWGSLLREIGSYPALAGQPWRFVALGLLILVLTCFQVVFSTEEVTA